MVWSNNVKTREKIKIKNYQYKTTNIKIWISIRIHLKYEQYENTEKKNYENLETNGIRFKDSNNKSTFIYVCVWGGQN